MVASRLMDQAAAGQIDLARITLADLDSAYKEAKKAGTSESAALAACRKYAMGSKLEAEILAQVEDAKAIENRGKEVLVKLQAKDPAVYKVWQLISDVTMQQCLATCRDLNAIVLPEHTAGESAYAEALGPLVDDLLSRGVAEISQGAAIVRVDDLEPGPPPAPPVLIRKSDGGYLYATTDMAAIRHRCQTLKADRVVYVVGAPQMLHFKQVFAAARKAGYAERAGKPVSLEHAAFGAILGEDGKPFKTRSGQSAKLQDLVDLAQDRAQAVLAERAELSESDRATIASAVSISALRYTDMSSERLRDYVFSPERMVAFEGNTGPYLLYALVRIKSIFRKAAERFGPAEAAAAAAAPVTLGHSAEKNLAMALLRYASVTQDVGRTLEPHRLCAFIYELAGAYASFFDACPVLTAPDEATRRSRLRLCSLTERVLVDALTLLGIPVIDRM
jgi:arginyl-tRNA synthetase